MISMLIPASASASNMSAATPGWERMPAPIRETLAMSESCVHRLAPTSSHAASRIGSATARSDFGSVNEMSVSPAEETFWTIMSMFTPASASARKTRAATPGRSGTPISVNFASEVSCVTPEMIAFSSNCSSSSRIHVPCDVAERRAHVQAHAVVARELDGA